jgi:hypothetical protein
MYAAMRCSKSLNSISKYNNNNPMETLDGRNLSIMHYIFSAHGPSIKPYVVTDVPEAVRNPTVI